MLLFYDKIYLFCRKEKNKKSSSFYLGVRTFNRSIIYSCTLKNRPKFTFLSTVGPRDTFSRGDRRPDTMGVTEISICRQLFKLKTIIATNNTIVSTAICKSIGWARELNTIWKEKKCRNAMLLETFNDC